MTDAHALLAGCLPAPDSKFAPPKGVAVPTDALRAALAELVALRSDATRLTVENERMFEGGGA